MWGLLLLIDLMLRQHKHSLRHNMRALRQARQSQCADASYLVAQQFLAHISLPANAIIASYSAMDNEIDPTFLSVKLRQSGHPIALPAISAQSKVLTFRLYAPEDTLVRHAYGMLEPDPSLPVITPDIILVPLLAFDLKRNRLGYGGGYYDATLDDLTARCQVTAIGLAYGFQKLNQLPTDIWDKPLDRIVTEKDVI